MAEKIKEIEIYNVSERSSEKSSPWSSTMIIVKVTTSGGIVGYGESPTTFMTLPVKESVEEVKRVFLNKDVNEVNKNVTEFYKHSFYLSRSMEATSALSAVEMACWDIIGKSCKEPVYNLLGGKVRDSIRAYSNGWYSDCVTADDFVDKAKEIKNKGFDAVKFDPCGNNYDTINKNGLENVEDIVSSLRNSFGDSLDLLIEFHGRFSMDAARKVTQILEPYDCFFYEEPLHPELEMRLPELRSTINTPVALGERVLNARDFMRNIVEGKVDIIQPDVTNSRGILESFRIATVADAWGVPVAFHNAFGPVQTAATLNLDTTINNFIIQESFEESWPDWKKKLLKSGYKLENGHFKLSGKPGLGIEMDEKSLKDHLVSGMEPYDPDTPSWVVSGTYVGEGTDGKQ
ncbi:MAG: mandelate racemase/muconate lactonizing enzyme family protein [Candidatus Thermoplasmatota archaeon]|nr:mandelate racemase/muconate lactonizing enzyme family protein [Candidatus Thermoplasmatota archaeon]MCL5889080.1 mandelate racemase/muconate lactonizing enzyme family protein [Candidatus Thermoplasmatota archaeon]